jgi:hypothetical protein
MEDTKMRPKETKDIKGSKKRDKDLNEKGNKCLKI